MLLCFIKTKCFVWSYNFIEDVSACICEQQLFHSKNITLWPCSVCRRLLVSPVCWELFVKKCFLFIYQWDIYTKDSQLLVICESQIWKDMFWRFKVTAGEPELGLKPPVEKYKWRKVPNSSQKIFMNSMHLSYVRLKIIFSTINTKIINYVLPFNIIYYFIIIFLNIFIKLFLHQPPPCRRLTM